MGYPAVSHIVVVGMIVCVFVCIVAAGVCEFRQVIVLLDAITGIVVQTVTFTPGQMMFSTCLVTTPAVRGSDIVV